MKYIDRVVVNGMQLDILQSCARLVMRWYGDHGSQFSWRAQECGVCADPYAVWVSEIMLQQTTVEVVERYYQAFMQAFPHIDCLARSDINNVLSLWQGLGYYRRPHCMHRCAQMIMQKHKGLFPEDILDLKKLPGIGDYTAGAIRSIAFQKPAVALDTNVCRVLGRVLNIAESDRKVRLNGLLGELCWQGVAPGDFYQGLMDIGRHFCTKRIRICTQCPLRLICLGKDTVESVVPRAGVMKPIKKACFFVYQKGAKYYFCKGTPEGKMLAGMWIFPSTAWMSVEEFACTRHGWPEALRVQTEQVVLKHTFSHFTLHAYIIVGQECVETEEGAWLTGEEKNYPLSTLARNLLSHQKKERL